MGTLPVEENEDNNSDAEFTPPNIWQAMQAQSTVRNFIIFINPLSADVLRIYYKMKRNRIYIKEKFFNVKKDYFRKQKFLNLYMSFNY